MFYLIINKNKKEIISNQAGMKALYNVLYSDIKNIRELILLALSKELSTNSFDEETLLIFQKHNIEINLINQKFIRLKDLEIKDKIINSLTCLNTVFLKLLEDWEKFKNDAWKQFVVLFDGKKFIITPIYAENSMYVKNIIQKNKDRFYLISIYDKIDNNTTEYSTLNNSGLYLISFLFGDPTTLIYNLDEIQEFLKPFTNYAMCYEDICINCLNDDSIEINGRDEEIDRKIKLNKENFFEITTEFNNLQNEFGISKVWNLKKLKIIYFNNTVSFEYELNPEVIKELAE